MNVIQLRNVIKTFPVNEEIESDRICNGLFYALNNITLEICKGSCTVIAGSNGSGKSILMSIIAKLEYAQSGNIDIIGTVGLIFQDADSQILGETPREDIMIGIEMQNIPKKDSIIIVEKLLNSVGLGEKIDSPSRALSGGEKRKLAVAGVLAMNADIIIFDEPYSNLDYPGVLQVNNLIKNLISQKKTIIILTHELEKCIAYAELFVVLHKGRIVFCGSPDEGLKKDLRGWGIKNPLYKDVKLSELVWL